MAICVVHMAVEDGVILLDVKAVRKREVFVSLMVEENDVPWRDVKAVRNVLDCVKHTVVDVNVLKQAVTIAL